MFDQVETSQKHHFWINYEYINYDVIHQQEKKSHLLIFFFYAIIKHIEDKGITREI